jgi:hypothetical protein
MIILPPMTIQKVTKRKMETRVRFVDINASITDADGLSMGDYI